jgi:hypothetical protein
MFGLLIEEDVSRLANLEYMNLEENITQGAVSYIGSVE